VGWRTPAVYGEDCRARKPSTFAANCLQARRLAERGVRFIQLFHRGYNITEDPVQVHDLQATILPGIDHRRLTFLFQGRHFRLTDVEGDVVRAVLI
jgi:Protein of unknown function (DUF1501)